MDSIQVRIPLRVYEVAGQITHPAIREKILSGEIQEVDRLPGRSHGSALLGPKLQLTQQEADEFIVSIGETMKQFDRRSNRLLFTNFYNLRRDIWKALGRSTKGNRHDVNIPKLIWDKAESLFPPLIADKIRAYPLRYRGNFGPIVPLTKTEISAIETQLDTRPWLKLTNGEYKKNDPVYKSCLRLRERIREALATKPRQRMTEEEDEEVKEEEPIIVPNVAANGNHLLAAAPRPTAKPAALPVAAIPPSPMKLAAIRLCDSWRKLAEKEGASGFAEGFSMIADMIRDIE